MINNKKIAIALGILIHFCSFEANASKQIFVRDPEGRTFTYDVELSDSIEAWG